MKYLVLVFILFTFTYGSTDPLIASYDKGLDLILVHTTYESWYSDMILDKHGFYPPDAMEQARDYSAGNYWNSNDNTYYYFSMIETNNHIYKSI